MKRRINGNANFGRLDTDGAILAWIHSALTPRLIVSPPRSRPLTRQEYVNVAHTQSATNRRAELSNITSTKTRDNVLKGLNKMLKDSYRQSEEVIMHYFCFCRRKQMITGTQGLCLAAKKALFCCRDVAEASLKVANAHKQG